MATAPDWFGKVVGSQKELQGRLSRDKQERRQAEKLKGDANIILSQKEVQGYWDANRVLETTLHGGRRQITSDDLAIFRHNMRQVQRRLSGRGITARQVINLASGTPLIYSTYQRGAESDVDKARRNITQALPISASNGRVRFITNSSPTSKVTRHGVIVEFLAWKEACNKLAALNKPKESDVRAIANWMRKQYLTFDCDCERHRYFFRYLATIGGYNAGRDETGYPKIRNPRLQGVACMHVIRVMTEIENSAIVLNFLTKHLMKVVQYKAHTTLSQKEAKKVDKQSKPSDIDPSIMIKAKVALRRFQNKIFGTQKRTEPPAKRANASRNAAQPSFKEKIVVQFSLAKNKLLKLFGK